MMKTQPYISRRIFVYAAIVSLIFALMSPAVAQTQSSRPYNLFNVSHFRVTYLISSARALAMGGVAIAATGEPTTISINPAGLAQFQFPAASLGHRFRNIDHAMPATTCAQGHFTFKADDFVNDQTMVNVIIPTRFLKVAVFREVVIDKRISTVTPQVLQFSSANQQPSEVLQTNFPTRQTQLNFDVVDNAFALAFRLSSALHFGAAFRLTGFDYHLSELDYFANDHTRSGNQACVENRLQADHLYLVRSVNESKWRSGVSAGMLMKISKRLTFGAIFLHRPRFDLNVDIIAPVYSVFADENSPSQSFPALSESARIAFDLPDVYGFGLAYRDFKRLTAGVDLQYIRYSEIANALTGAQGNGVRNLIQDDNPVTAADPDGVADLTISDGLQISAGVEYGITPKSKKLPYLPYKFQALYFRAGYLRQPGGMMYANEANPQFRHVFPRQKGINFLTLGLGAVVEVQSSRVRVDVAFSYSAESVEAIVSGAIFIF